MAKKQWNWLKTGSTELSNGDWRDCRARSSEDEARSRRSFCLVGEVQQQVVLSNGQDALVRAPRPFTVGTDKRHKPGLTTFYLVCRRLLSWLECGPQLGSIAVDCSRSSLQMPNGRLWP